MCKHNSTITCKSIHKTTQWCKRCGAYRIGDGEWNRIRSVDSTTSMNEIKRLIGCRSSCRHNISVVDRIVFGDEVNDGTITHKFCRSCGASCLVRYSDALRNETHIQFRPDPFVITPMSHYGVTWEYVDLYEDTGSMTMTFEDWAMP